MVKVAVVGATGYTGEELVNCLFTHPDVKLTALAALVEKADKFSEMFPAFKGKVDLVCKNLDVDEVASACDLVFLALPHTVSMKFAPEFLKKGKKVIDLSADYRLPADVYEKWYSAKHLDTAHLSEAVYGLPEINRKKIKDAKLIANPGCYPTSVILGLLPVIKLIEKNGATVIVDSKSGVTGAGRKGHVTLSFGEVDEDLKAYKANEHQHIPEMEHILGQAAGKKMQINFTPHLVPIRRGIMSTIYVTGGNMPSTEEIQKLYSDLYAKEPFVRVRKAGDLPRIQDVAGTNFCDIGVKAARGILVIVSVIDNLLKGAAGQAVQNMNIMYGSDEKAGLL